MLGCKTRDRAQSGWPTLLHLEVLVGLSNRQHSVSVVDSTELTKRAQQPLAVVAVPLHPLLLVLCAHQNLKHEED